MPETSPGIIIYIQLTHERCPKCSPLHLHESGLAKSFSLIVVKDILFFATPSSEAGISTPLALAAASNNATTAIVSVLFMSKTS